MRQPRRTAAPLLLAALLSAALVGCNGDDRQRREQAQRAQAAAAQRQRVLDALVSRCQRQQKAVQTLVMEYNQTRSALNRLNQERYRSLPQPPAPDPAVLERYTRIDQELELERHAQNMTRWRAADGDERRRWVAAQDARRQELTALELQASQALLRLGVAETPEARLAWSRCDGPQLMALTQNAAR